MANLLVACLLITLIVQAESQACQTPLAVHQLPGNIHIAGLFAAHSGVNCSHLEPEGFQQLTSLLSVIQTLRNVNYIPGITIGLSVYDTCSSIETAHKVLVNAMVQTDCLQAVSVGCISTAPIAGELASLLEPLGIPVTPLMDPHDPNLLSSLGVNFLLAKDWSTVDWLLTSSDYHLSQFLQEASQHRLCIKHQALLSNLREIPEGIVIVVARWADLEDSLRVGDSTKLLLISLDGEVNFKSDRLPRETYALVPTMLELPGADNTTGHLIEAVQAPLFLQLAADTLQVLNLFKTSLAAYCPPGTICNAFQPIKQHAVTRPVLRNPRLVSYILNTLQMDDNFDGYTVFYKIPDETTFYDHFGSFKIINEKWTFESEALNHSNYNPTLCRNIPSDNTTGVDCTYCSNFDDIYHQYFEDLMRHKTLHNIVEWRTESWVAAIASVSMVGVICSIAIAVFILIRICKHDILEGNPCFSFLLIISIIFTYASIIPFSFHVVDDHHFYKGIICAARLFGTSLSYALLFSIMLARNFMLATCDQDGGFMSHVNGYHQTVLCFFIAAVQIGLSVQFWVINWRFLPEDQCTPMTDGNLFILSLCYDMFLLVLLVLTSPFVLRSKRNYNEGGYFAASSVFCLFVWMGWVTGFIILPQEYNDIFIVSGLCATASILLVTIFIPRTYLMMTGIVRDHLASALPSLAYQSSNSVIDVNYRSTQALYDSVNPISVTRGQSNPNFYSDHPNTPSTSKLETIPRIRTISPVPDNTYERYGSPPTPLNVTRF